jgi:hypothetical protein
MIEAGEAPSIGGRAQGRISPPSANDPKLIHQCRLEHRSHLFVGINIVFGQVLDGIYDLLPNVFPLLWERAYRRGVPVA